MISTNKDFDGISNNSHPSVYYWSSDDTKPSDNIMNGAVGIEMDSYNDTIYFYFYDKSSNNWVYAGTAGGES